VDIKNQLKLTREEISHLIKIIKHLLFT